MLKKWKILLYLLSAFALLCLSTVFSYYLCNENVHFERFCNKLFIREISADTLSLHYILSHPEVYGIDHAASTLPFYEAESSAKSCAQIEDYLHTLSKIQPSKLTPDNQYTYELLVTYLESLLRLKQYPFFDEPFSPVNGVHSQFPILLSEYTFRTEKDIQDYLQILAAGKSYFDSLLCYQKEKTKAGLGTDDLSLSKSATQCLSMLTKDELENNSHFLQSSFYEKANALYKQGIINATQFETYLLENNALLLEVLYPTYQSLSQELINLQTENESEPQGLAHYPKGKEYYRYLVQFETGSIRSIFLVLHSAASPCIFVNAKMLIVK